MNSSAHLNAKREVSSRGTMKHLSSFDSRNFDLEPLVRWQKKQCISQWFDSIAHEQRRCCRERGHDGHHHWNSKVSGYSEHADYDVIWSDTSPLVMFRG